MLSCVMWWDLLSRSRRAHVEWCLRKGDWRFMWCLGQRDCYQPGDDPGCHQPLFLVWSAKEKGWADVHPLPVLGIEIIARQLARKTWPFFSVKWGMLCCLCLCLSPLAFLFSSAAPLLYVIVCVCVCVKSKSQLPICNTAMCHTIPCRTGIGW